jgi:hypothetical protein
VLLSRDNFLLAKAEAATLTKAWLLPNCFMMTDIFWQSLPPGVHICNCKNNWLHEDRKTTKFKIPDFYT